jgi:5-methylcytosine-specific restriction endonuclease McrA
MADGLTPQYRKYEHSTHNCLENVYQSLGTIYRCSECLHETPSPARATEIIHREQSAQIEWFELERRRQRLTIDKYKRLAAWSTLCAHCGRYIRERQSWVVDLLQPHPRPQWIHNAGDTFHPQVTGHWIHFGCYKIILRELPCYYCGETPAGTIDHANPQSKDGEDEPYNMIAACVSCNSSKGTRNVHNFTSYSENVREDQS